jgi:polyisoprenoid-binding protein YceI
MNRNHLFAATLALTLAATTATSSRAADTYQIDPAHTSIGFAVSHMVITKVRGRFDKFEGLIELDPAGPAVQAAKLTIQAASINTGIQKRDDHLRTADFFHVEKYPHITFELKRVEKKGDQLVAIGDFTMHGVTRQLELPFKLNGPITDPWGNSRIGIEGRATINRRDYGLTWSQVLEAGGLVVGDEVEIEIFAEAIKRKAE